MLELQFKLNAALFSLGNKFIKWEEHSNYLLSFLIQVITINVQQQ